MLPFAGGVTGSGTNPQLAPAGRFAQFRSTGLLNPLIELTVHVPVASSPGVVVKVVGEHATVKSGVGGTGTLSVISNVWVKSSFLPVTVNGYEPGVTPLPTVRVNVVFTELFAGGVTGSGLNAKVTPAGSPVVFISTGEWNPFTDEIVQVTVPLSPISTVTGFGVHEILKLETRMMPVMPIVQ